MSDVDNNEVVPELMESEESDQEEMVGVDDSDFNGFLVEPDDESKQRELSEKTFHRRISLIPKEVSSITEATQNFSSVFKARYGSSFAPFFHGSLQDAALQAFGVPGIPRTLRDPAVKRRPLALYLHDDSSIASNIFAQNVICSEEVSSLLSCQYTVWAWDMSEKSDRLFEFLAMSGMKDVEENIMHIPTSKYPLLVVVVKSGSTIYPASIIRGYDGVPQAVEKLKQGLNMYSQIETLNVVEEIDRDEEEHEGKKQEEKLQQMRELSRIERELLQTTQQEEYNLSLAIDRSKQAQPALKRQHESDQKERNKEQERQKLIAQAVLSSTLPREPAASDPDIITIRIRLPMGEHKIRRFQMNEPVKWLVTFIESIGYDMQEYQVWTSDMPKKNLSALDLTKTFKELRWQLREQVTVAEK